MAMSDKDRDKFIADKREELRTHRFQTGGRNVSAVREARKDISRAFSVMTTKIKDEEVK